MKRLLIAVGLTMVVLAVAAAPAFAALDSQAGGPVGAPHATMANHAAGAATTGARTSRVVLYRAHGRHIVVVPASSSAGALSIALLAILVCGLIVAAFAERRQAPDRAAESAKSARPARLPAFKPASNREHRAT